MPEWLQNNPGMAVVHTPGSVAVCLLTAFVCGLMVAATYWLAQRRANANPYVLSTTLVLLTILVAMTAMVIGDSPARAFSLVGALSIVRFRTAVDDTRDTAYVIYAVVVGMALGAGQFGVCLIGIPVVSLVALGLSRLSLAEPGLSGEHRLEIRLAAEHDVNAVLNELLTRELISHRLTQLVTARQGAAIDLRYAVRMKPSTNPTHLMQELQKLDGVQSVEWREG